jgi:putative tricarboxylic transport membrane protein
MYPAALLKRIGRPDKRRETMTKCGKSLATATGVLASVLAVAAPVTVSAQEALYSGKQVTLIVPNSPSGTMTQYARTLAPYIAKHLGAKNVRVENQTGAGGLKGTNALWRAAPDGLTFAFTNVPVLIMAQLAESSGVQFDATKFTYLGRASSEPRVLVVGGKSKVTSAKDINSLGRPFVYAAQGTDEDFYSTVVLADALGFKLKIVTGYEGNSDTALAVIKGDADGHMAGWVAVKTATEAGDLRPIIVMEAKRLDALPNVPSALELVQDPAKKPSMLANIAILNMGRGFFGPPNMNEETTRSLRAGIAAAFKDPALIDEAAKRNLPLAFASGEEQQAGTQQVTAAAGGLKQLLKSALESIR